MRVRNWLIGGSLAQATSTGAPRGNSGHPAALRTTQSLQELQWLKLALPTAAAAMMNDDVGMNMLKQVQTLHRWPL
jgi:hypothetical protein